METDESMYKNFFLLYKLHQSLMMMMSPFLLIRFISKPNASPHTHTLTCTHTHTHTHTHTQRHVTAVNTANLATQHALHITHSREENKNKSPLKWNLCTYSNATSPPSSSFFSSTLHLYARPQAWCSFGRRMEGDPQLQLLTLAVACHCSCLVLASPPQVPGTPRWLTPSWRGGECA